MTAVHRRHHRLLLPGVLSLLMLLCAPPRAGQSDVSAAQQGAITLEVNRDTLVPGNLLEVSYKTSPGTLQGPVDIYFAVTVPNDPQLLFLQSDGTLVPKANPFRTTVTITEGTTTLFSFYPILPYGSYTLYMALVHTGVSLDAANAFASAITIATFTFTALSPAQQTLIKQRGNPDLLTVAWDAANVDKRETWSYYSGTPTHYTFENGTLIEQSALAGSLSGTPPRLDPSLFTPTTTVAQLTAVLGAPTTTGPIFDGVPDYQGVSFAQGLDVIFFQGQFSFARTSTP